MGRRRTTNDQRRTTNDQRRLQLVVGLWSFLVWCLFALCPGARSEKAESIAARVRQLEAVSPKAVVLVFDISGSMGSNEMLARAREAVIQMVRGGLKAGDTLAVFTFDTATRKTAERVVGEEGAEAAVQDVPGELSDKPGTNIRWAHHEALRWVEQKRPKKTFMILITDSYNDPPAANDPARKEYAAYYLPKTLTRYPDTPENRDYERLLKRRQALGIQEWGIGVEINPATGRPIERYPAAMSTESAPAAARGPRGPYVPMPPPERSTHWWTWLVAALVGLAVAAALWAMASKPLDVSLAESARSYRNYRLRPGAAIRLGGAGASEDDLAYPIPGTPEPVAAVRRVGSGFRLEPGPGAVPGPGILLNQEPLKTAAKIAPGDEIKIRLPAAGPASAPRELRLEFGRARDEFV